MAMFKKRVLGVVAKIPPGKVLTYRQVAELAGHPLAYRAVGNILNKNYNPLIPCHRVICTNSNSGGYNRGLNAKIHLLKREGIIFLKTNNKKVDLLKIN